MASYNWESYLMTQTFMSLWSSSSVIVSQSEYLNPELRFWTLLARSPLGDPSRPSVDTFRPLSTETLRPLSVDIFRFGSSLEAAVAIALWVVKSERANSIIANMTNTKQAHRYMSMAVTLLFTCFAFWDVLWVARVSIVRTVVTPETEPKLLKCRWLIPRLFYFLDVTLRRWPERITMCPSDEQFQILQESCKMIQNLQDSWKNLTRYQSRQKN